MGTRAVIKLLSEDKLDEIRASVSAYLATVPATHVVSHSPVATYAEKDGDTRFVVAVCHHEPGAVDVDGQFLVIDRDKVTRAQADVDDALAGVVHAQLAGDTSVAGTVTVDQAFFAATDVGRRVGAGGEWREIATVVSAVEVTYVGQALPASAVVTVYGAEAVRDVSVDTRLRGDQDTRVALVFTPGGGVAAGQRAVDGGVDVNVVSVSADYVAGYDVAVVFVDTSAGEVEITLPAERKGHRLVIKRKSGAYNVVVTAAGADTIEGQADGLITGVGDAWELTGEGNGNWWLT